MNSAELRSESPGLMDTPEPLGMASLELHRRSIAGSPLTPRGVAERLDAVEDGGPRGFSRPVDLPATAFTPDQLEEARRHAVVVAVAPAAPAERHVAFAQEFLPCMARETIPDPTATSVPAFGCWRRSAISSMENECGVDATGP